MSDRVKGSAEGHAGEGWRVQAQPDQVVLEFYFQAAAGVFLIPACCFGMKRHGRELEIILKSNQVISHQM